MKERGMERGSNETREGERSKERCMIVHIFTHSFLRTNRSLHLLMPFLPIPFTCLYPYPSKINIPTAKRVLFNLHRSIHSPPL